MLRNSALSSGSSPMKFGVYVYHFNGKETDEETGVQDYGMRMYNALLGRFLSVDPLIGKYPELTPYQFTSNTPICAIDVDGLEKYIIIRYNYDGVHYRSTIKKVPANVVKNQANKTGFAVVNVNIPAGPISAKTINDAEAQVEADIMIAQNNNTGLDNAMFGTTYNVDPLNQDVRNGSYIEQSEILTKMENTNNNTEKMIIGSTFTTEFANNDASQTSIDATLSPADKQWLTRLAAVALDPTISPSASQVTVTGYASATPTNYKSDQINMQNNIQLTQDRADAGKAWLVSYINTNFGVSVDPNRINEVGAGTPAQPAGPPLPGTTPDDPSNRRITIKNF